MKNDNRKSLSLYRELFNRATWGGAWGGGSLVTAMEVEGYSSFSWKTHIFEATEGAIMGGRMEGRKNGGANGVANFHIHGGALQTPVSHFVAEKMRFLQ